MTGEPPTVDGPKAPDPLVGTVLADRYRIEKQIGEGGMGTVYLARHILLEKVVALKVLHDEYARRRELVERFLHEARAASRIRHEHVIDITDFGETATKNVFFAMEYLEGHELATELDRSGTLPWPRIKKIMLQLCSALQAAHEAGVIHRDLKPENIFLIEKFGNPEFVKVLDFGVAKLTELEDKTRRLTRTGMVFGTPEYMSPEQARGEKPDIRVDVYACGCILYEMVTGQVPFTGDSFMGVLTKQLFDPVPRVAERASRTDLPPGLQAVLDEALAKNREERFASMNELAVAIDTLDNLAGVVYAAPGVDPGPRKTTPRPAPSAVLAPMPANPTVRMSVAPVALTPAQRPATTDQDRAATIPWTPPPPPAAPPPIAVAPVAVPAPAPPPPRPSPGLTPAPASFGDMGIQFDDDTASLRLPVNKRRRLIIGGSVVAAVAAVAIIAVATSGKSAPEAALVPAAPTQPAAAAAAAPTPVVVVAPADAQPVAAVAPPDAQPIAVAPPPAPPPPPPVAVVKPPVAVAPPPDAAPVAVRPPVAAVTAAAPQHPTPAPAPAKVAASAPPPSVPADGPPLEHKKPKKRTASAGLPAPPPPETFPPTEPKAEKKPKAPAAKPKSDLKDPFAD